MAGLHLLELQPPRLQGQVEGLVVAGDVAGGGAGGCGVARRGREPVQVTAGSGRHPREDTLTETVVRVLLKHLARQSGGFIVT